MNSREITMIYTQSTHSISSTTANDYTGPRLVQPSVLRSRDEFPRLLSLWFLATGVPTFLSFFRCLMFNYIEF